MAETLPVWITVDGAEPSPALEAFLQEVSPYGVILFARHLKSPEQVRALCAALRAAGAAAPKIALDQEGGRVSRLRELGFAFPGAAELGGDPGRARALAREQGGALADLGFDVDFAPVADLGPAAPGTGLEGRCYGDDPRTVTACCAAFLEGLAAAGVAGCLKHFPGLGGSLVDSHRSLPRVSGDRTAREPHLAPFAALAAAAPYVMTAHGRYDFLAQAAPSSLNPETYLLLRALGFAGRSVTDDLNMGAVKGEGTLGERAAASLRAGADLALWVGPERETVEACAAVRAAGPDCARATGGT